MTLSMRTEMEVPDPRTSGVGPSQRLGFLVLTKRSATCGKENAIACEQAPSEVGKKKFGERVGAS